jgi:RNA polymerase sigma-B factor
MNGSATHGSHLSQAEAAALHRAYRCDGDTEARARLIEAYLPLARALARRFAHRGERLEDLVQVAALGLINAIDRFDAERGSDLAAFAVPTIVGELKRHLRDRAGVVRVPRRHQETKLRVQRARRELTATLQRPPTRLELVAATELSEHDVVEASRAEEASAPAALREDTWAMTADDVYRATEERLDVWSSLRALHRRERDALRCRYFADMSQSEVARALGISQTQASRLLASGLTKLRVNLAGNRDLATKRELHSAHGDSRRRQGRAA